MNGGLYSAAEIEASYKGLEGTPAPLGHPKVGNQFVPARSPHAINKHWIGAWNENVRREGGRVLLDKVVNIRVANQTAEGRELIQAIEKQQPIHTSTGLELEIKVANGESKGKRYTWSAHNMQFDHDAILIGEPGAATPAEGVGMFVNAAGDEAEVLQANVEFSDDAEYEITAAAEHIIRIADRAEQREQNKGRVERFVEAIKSAIGGAQSQSSQTTTTANANAPEGDMSLTKEQLEAALAPITQALNTQGEQIKTLATNQQADSEALKALKANADAAAKAESAKLDEKLKANGWTDEELSGMTANAKQKVVNSLQPRNGFHLNSAFAGSEGEDTNTLPE
ncbi:DUF2213 domain-containing protein [Salinicola lusitanus]|uniref:DUF2213 domain-containing protein n=1 Tax=Salinicola lusitanus TaxID=1949085 RepID=UPI0013008387|nr:DUF2213 domain-containing protein [Salinicola lusitanus]